MKPTTLFYLTSLFNGFVVVSLFVYFPIVYLNYTYTSTYLTAADIPYYAGADTSTGAWTADRYQYQWFEMAFDILRFSAPLMALSAIANGSMTPKTSMFWVYQVALGLLVVCEIWKLVMRLFVGWAFCSYNPFCHNFDPTVSTANYVFLIAAWSCIPYGLADVAYFFIIDEARYIYDESRIEARVENMGGYYTARGPPKLAMTLDQQREFDKHLELAEQKKRRQVMKAKKIRSSSSRKYATREEEGGNPGYVGSDIGRW